MIGGIKENKGAMLSCPIDPSLELCPRKRTAGWIVRRAQIDNVYFFLRREREKRVFFKAREEGDLLSVIKSCRIVIGRVSRVDNPNSVVFFSKLLLGLQTFVLISEL